MLEKIVDWIMKKLGLLTPSEIESVEVNILDILRYKPEGLGLYEIYRTLKEEVRIATLLDILIDLTKRNKISKNTRPRTDADVEYCKKYPTETFYKIV